MREAPNLPPQSTPARRGGRVTDRIMTPEARARASTQPFLPRVLGPWFDRITEPGNNFTKNIDFDEVRIRLLRAGFPMGLRAKSFVGVKFVSTAVGAILFLACFPIFQIVAQMYGITLPLWLATIFPIIGCLYGFRMPDIWLGIKIKQRQNEIQMVLPDMIDLISVSVEAGLGLVAAIQRISERFNNPLSEEFLRTLQEVRLGRPQADALRDMARRVDVSDLSTLLTAIVQAELLGLAVANVLRVQSERLRERRSQRAREAAQKAPIKMTFPLVLFIFPALFIVILGPAMINIFLGQSTF
jgi:tight adherence protein C